MTGRFIGLGGKLRAGKDAVADHLVDAHGFIKVGMSDILNDAMLREDPWIPVNAQSPSGSSYVLEGQFVRYHRLIAEVGYVEAKKNPTVREHLQRLGTEVGRNLLGENIWVDSVAKRVAGLLLRGHDVVLTGVRFPNEVHMVEDLDGLTVWVSRPSLTPGDAAPHASETGVNDDDFERVIVNDGTLEDLYKTTDTLLKESHIVETTRYPIIPQKVLVDDAAVMDLAEFQPSDPTKAVVESFVSGPIVLDRSRIKPLA